MKSFSAVLEEEPFEQSSAISIPSKSQSTAETRWSIYKSAASVSYVTLPIFSSVADAYGTTWSSTISSILFSRSSGSLHPSELKILIPLNSNGLCDAEIIIPASALYLPTR